MNDNTINIAVVGIGYIGLPVSISFSKFFNTIAFDQDVFRVSELNKGFDRNLDYTKKEIRNKNNKIHFTSNHEDIDESNIFIVCVPTPIFNSKKPNLNYLKKVSKIISPKLKNNDIVIYESTVYPGVTEEICLPILKKYTKLIYNKDFFIGYCPERINPGDKKNTIKDIAKIVSASNNNTLNQIYYIYKKIIKNKIYKAKNIKVAESAKVIENTQRDINIALMNEFSIIFDKLNINFYDVLNAAETKWNFIKFYPGLVGGHCIGVDPYYLSYIAKKNNISTSLITAGRNINDNYSKFIFNKILRISKFYKQDINKINFLIYGLTFKENCPDFRNSKSLDLIKHFRKNKLKFRISDPYINSLNEKQLLLYKKYLDNDNYKADFLIYLVAHRDYKKHNNRYFKKKTNSKYIIYDLKQILNQKKIQYPNIYIN